MRLDQRLKKSILELVRNMHPEWVHQEEIYTHLENNIEFTEKQKELHKQKAGQIEPNWQHDARNLQHSMKREGVLINPRKDAYALPTKVESKFSDNDLWRICLENANANPDFEINEDYITIRSTKISRNLVIERFRHLEYCGGVLPKGQLHNWTNRESAIVELLSCIRDEGDLLVIEGFDFEGGGFISVHLNQEERYSRTLLRAADLVGLHQQQILEETGMSTSHRRTIPREEKKEVSTGKIPYAEDANGEYVYMRDGPWPGAEHSRRLGYKCPFCGFGMSARALTSESVTPYWGHFQNNPNKCSFQLNRENIATSLDEGKEQQRKSNHLNLILKKEGFAPWKLLTNGDNYHGFPVDESMRMREFTPRNLSLGAASSVMNNWWSSNFKNDVAPNLIVNDWEQQVSASLRYPKRSLKTMSAPGINFGDVFVFANPDSLYAERVRPSAICKNHNDRLIIKDYTFIGIVAGEQNTYSKIQYEKKFRLRKDLPYFIEIYDLTNNQHAEELALRKILMKKSNSERAAILEVLIHSPIHAHPKNPEMVFLSNDEELVLLVDHHNNEKQLYADIVNRPSGDSSALGNPTDYFGENWTISTHKKGNLSRENLQVQSNAYQDMRKPSRGITIKTHDIHSVENTEIEGVHVYFKKYSSDGDEVYDEARYQIFSPNVIMLDYFPTDLLFSSPLKSISDPDLEIFDVQVIINGRIGLSKRAVNIGDYLLNSVYSEYSIEDVVNNIGNDNSDFDKIEKIEIKLNQEKTGFSGDTLPKIVIDITGSYEKIKFEIEEERREAAKRLAEIEAEAEKEKQKKEFEERRIKLMEPVRKLRKEVFQRLIDLPTLLKLGFDRVSLVREIEGYLNKCEYEDDESLFNNYREKLMESLAKLDMRISNSKLDFEKQKQNFREKSQPKINLLKQSLKESLQKWASWSHSGKYNIDDCVKEVNLNIDLCEICFSENQLESLISKTEKSIKKMEKQIQLYMDEEQKSQEEEIILEELDNLRKDAKEQIELYLEQKQRLESLFATEEKSKLNDIPSIIFKNTSILKSLEHFKFKLDYHGLKLVLDERPKRIPLRYNRIKKILVPFTGILNQYVKEIDNAVKELNNYIPSELRLKAKEYRKAESKPPEVKIPPQHRKNELDNNSKAREKENAGRSSGDNNTTSTQDRLNSDIENKKAEIKTTESRISTLEKKIRYPTRKLNNFEKQRIENDLRKAKDKLQRIEEQLADLEKEFDAI